MLRWLRAYTAHDDPKVAACNTIAMVIAWNQPYYPLYLLWIVGRDAWVGIPDAFSGFLFFAVPAIGRRSPLLGRIAMVVFSVANVVFCSMMLGEAAGIQLLFLPCGMLAAILFSWRERLIMLVMTALPLCVWLVTRGRLNHPPVVFPAEAYRSLFTLNAVSAGSLMIFGLDASRDHASFRGTWLTPFWNRIILVTMTRVMDSGFHRAAAKGDINI